MNTAVRRIGPQDWELLRDLRLAALQDAPGAFASTYARERDDGEARWRARLERGAWFGAGDETGGLAAGMPSSEGRPDRCQLISMWVHPARRGTGLAGLLTRAVRDWAVSVGARELALWVADGNEAAARAYVQSGFVPTGRRQPLPSNPAVGEEQWLLWLDRPPQA